MLQETLAQYPDGAKILIELTQKIRQKFGVGEKRPYYQNPGEVFANVYKTYFVCSRAKETKFLSDWDYKDPQEPQKGYVKREKQFYDEMMKDPWEPNPDQEAQKSKKRDAKA